VQKRAGPFQVIDNDGHSDPNAPSTPQTRNYDCDNYEKCLNLAAALNWESFSCGGCNGKVNEALQWRAQKAKRDDALVDLICTVPDVTVHHSEWNPASKQASERPKVNAKSIQGGKIDDKPMDSALPPSASSTTVALAPDLALTPESRTAVNDSALAKITRAEVQLRLLKLQSK